MYELKKKIGKVFTSKSVGTRPSSYEKRIYGVAVSQRLRNTAVGALRKTGLCEVESNETLKYVLARNLLNTKG